MKEIEKKAEELKRKAEEYVRTLRAAGINMYNHCDIEKAYCKGYEQGYEDCRHYAHDYYKPKWHDLRKNPNDLPKISDRYLCVWEGGYQDIMDFDTEANSFGYWCGTYDNQSLGFIDSVFETIKERGEDEVIAWIELPSFMDGLGRLDRRC